MKLQKIFLSLLLLVGSTVKAATNQCLISENQSKTVSEDTKKRLDDCVKTKSCKFEDRPFICPWAFERRKEKPVLSEEDRDLIEKTCQQCEQLAIISCGYQLDAANMQFNKLMKIFIEDNDPNKPLIFGFEKPTPISNNVNLSANITKLSEDNEAYKAEMKVLTTKLSALATNITTQDMVRTNIKKSQQLVTEFAQKWGAFHKNSIQLYKLITELEDFMVDWHDRIRFLKEQEGCQPMIEQVNKAFDAGSDVITRLDQANEILENLEFGKRLELTSEFSENSIKQSYVKSSKKPLEDLLASIGSVLKLDEELTRSNLWWIELNRGGLLQGLHTTYYQYKKPMQLLVEAATEGQAYLERLRAIRGVSATAQNAAISALQNRIGLIQSDLAWLQSQGWKGQFQSQVDAANDTIKSLPLLTTPCGRLMKNYLDSAKMLDGDNYELFETKLEPSFMQAFQACEKE